MHIGNSAQLCTIMSSVKNGVVPLVLYCWSVLCILQGAKSYIVGTRYYSTLGATSTLIICDSRGLSAGDDAYEERDDQDGVLVMNIVPQESNFG